MIVGIGIDTVVVSRISKLISKYGDRFLKKVFTSREIEDGVRRLDKASFFAARFAAREAFYKALGTGFGRGISLKEVSVVALAKGRPHLELRGRAEEAVAGGGIDRLHLSITHDGDIAQAIVILESK